MAAAVDDPIHPLQVGVDWVAAAPHAALRTVTLDQIGADTAALGAACLAALAESPAWLSRARLAAGLLLVLRNCCIADPSAPRRAAGSLDCCCASALLCGRGLPQLLRHRLGQLHRQRRPYR